MSKNIWGSPWKAIGVIVVAGIILYGAIVVVPPLLSPTRPNTTTTTTGPTLTLPMVLVVLDQYTGSALATSASNAVVAVQVINLQTNIVAESLATTSGGLSVQTSLSYTSGAQWLVSVCRPTANCNPLSNSTSNTWYYTTVTVPYGQPNQTGQTTQVPISIYANAIGTYSITVLSDTSSSVSSNGVQTVAGVATKTYTVLVADSVDNTGYITFTNPQVHRTLALDLLLKVSGNSTTNPGVTVSDWSQWGTSANINGGATYYGQEPSSGWVNRQKLPDGTYPSGLKGSYSLTMTFNTAGIATQQFDQFTIRLYAFFSSAYFQSNTSINPEAVNSALFNFYIKRT